MIPPPEPGTYPPVLCPSCQRPLAHHRRSFLTVPCPWTPNDIAAWWLQHAEQAAVSRRMTWACQDQCCTDSDLPEENL
jgi:hypothetical protein